MGRLDSFPSTRAPYVVAPAIVTLVDMGYALPWYEDREQFPDHPDMWRGFTAQDYTLAYALDVADNYAAEDAVRDRLEYHDPDLVARIEFDSEMGCFFAHTKNKADMERLAWHVGCMVDACNPNAIPGTIEDSPATIRPWDNLFDV